jgi:glycosyltransferase involved in cell wall biosynthesis
MTAVRRPVVLHVIPAVAARYGGPSVAVVGMCRALVPTGVHAAIATTDADGPRRLPVDLETWTTHEGVETIFFRRRLSEAFKWSPGLSTWINSHVSDFDAVHIHAVFSHSSIAAGRACRRAGVPYVVRPLGTLDPWSVRRKSWQKRALLALGAADLLTGAAAIHYTTAEEQRLAESGFPSLPDGVVVPVGIDDICFDIAAPATGSGERYVLALSRLDAKKRIEWVIQAWHRLADVAGIGSWRLVIAGDGDPAYVARLRRLAAGGPSADRITFGGWTSGDRKRALLRGAALFVLPSHQENLGLGLVEAMACGVPALVTAGVNLGREVEVAQAGWCVPDDADAFADALRAAVGSDEERAGRGSKARAFAERFRWPGITAQLVDLYDRVARMPGAMPMSSVRGASDAGSLTTTRP